MKTLSISDAKQSLGRVADQIVDSGEPVVLVRGSKLLILQPYDPPAPIPNHPVGYFADAMTPEEIDESNLLAQDSPAELVD